MAAQAAPARVAAPVSGEAESMAGNWLPLLAALLVTLLFVLAYQDGDNEVPKSG